MRITPAHAGRSIGFVDMFGSPEDHPRTRGEKAGLMRVLTFTIGSPPHTRGEESMSDKEIDNLRITPAHAGRRLRDCSDWVAVQDHPRTRGEKLEISILPVTGLGSPPHTRGEDDRPREKVSANRITPAHAGRSVWRGRLCSCSRDHPRTRGEKTETRNPLRFNRGSPPHTRGEGNP